MFIDREYMLTTSLISFGNTLSSVFPLNPKLYDISKDVTDYCCQLQNWELFLCTFYTEECQSKWWKMSLCGIFVNPKMDKFMYFIVEYASSYKVLWT